MLKTMNGTKRKGRSFPLKGGCWWGGVGCPSDVVERGGLVVGRGVSGWGEDGIIEMWKRVRQREEKVLLRALESLD